jgi:hypothetical protein
MDTEFKTKMDAMVTRLDAFAKDHFAKNGYKHEAPRHRVTFGQKYARIVRLDGGNDQYGSAYCFVDAAGNIYKPAGWKAPAKHARGSIHDADFSIGKGLGYYGPVYLR